MLSLYKVIVRKISVLAYFNYYDSNKAL